MWRVERDALEYCVQHNDLIPRFLLALTLTCGMKNIVGSREVDDDDLRGDRGKGLLSNVPTLSRDAGLWFTRCYIIVYTV